MRRLPHPASNISRIVLITQKDRFVLLCSPQGSAHRGAGQHEEWRGPAMQVKRLVAAIGAAVLLLSGVSLTTATAASAVAIDGTTSSSSTDVSSYYPLDSCAPFAYPNAVGNLMTVTASSTGLATIALTATSYDDAAWVAVFEGSYAAANCIDSSLVTSAPFLPSVTIPVVEGQQYVILVMGCNSTCVSPASVWYGTYTLETSFPGVAAADQPPIPAWVQAYGRDSRDATCLDGWDASWQSWAEPVTGGWVCTRSIPSLG
jgi:hypothetical protein